MRLKNQSSQKNTMILRREVKNMDSKRQDRNDTDDKGSSKQDSRNYGDDNQQKTSMTGQKEFIEKNQSDDSDEWADN